MSRRYRTGIVLTMLTVTAVLSVAEHRLYRATMALRAIDRDGAMNATLMDYEDSWTQMRLFLHRILGVNPIAGLHLRIGPTAGDRGRPFDHYEYLRYLELIGDGTYADAALTDLSGEGEIRELSIHRCRLKDFKWCDDFPRLEGIVFNSCDCDDWESIAQAQQLKWIAFYAEPAFRDESALGSAKSVQRLHSLLPKCQVYIGSWELCRGRPLNSEVRNRSQ